MIARTKHGLTYEQCSRLADAYAALMECRDAFLELLPSGFPVYDPLERIILAAKRLSEEEIVEPAPEPVN